MGLDINIEIRNGLGEASIVAAELEFEVFDLTGRMIRSEVIQATKLGTHVLNLGPCQGFYILRVSENGKKLFQEKLLCLRN
jgi:hypothetical protein